MNRELITDAISELDEDLIADYYDTQTRLERRGKRHRQLFRLSAAAALLALCVGTYPWLSRQMGWGSKGNIFQEPKAQGCVAPAYLTAKPVQRIGDPITEAELADFLPAAKEDAIDLLLNHPSDPASVDGLRAEDLHFSNGFHHVQANEDGNYIPQDHLQYLILHGREVVGRLVVFRSDDSGELLSSPEGMAPSGKRLTELLRQYDGSELAMIYFGPFVEAALTPDGVIHYLNGITDLPAQSDDYYARYFTGDNCITGID